MSRKHVNTCPVYTPKVDARNAVRFGHSITFLTDIIQGSSPHVFTFFFSKQCSPHFRLNFSGINGMLGSQTVRASVCVREASRNGTQDTRSQ
jgi:hypothetical protein